tara:strand:- start:9643 stop:11721 length:2079 start_codon:yes stop_codon:yes gene_type:complete
MDRTTGVAHTFCTAVLILMGIVLFGVGSEQSLAAQDEVDAGQAADNAGQAAANAGQAAANAGQAAANAGQAAANAGYVDAISLLPDTTAGVMRIPNLPEFCDAWKKTHIGMLIDEPSMQPFIEAQRTRAENYLDSIDSSIGLRPQDLYDIASGEVVAAWLSFEKDKRRPYSACVIADIRGLKAKADKALDQVDKDLKAGGATRADVTHLGHTVRVYTTKPKPGQLKIDEIAITYDETRVIAADRQRVVTDLLDAIAGNMSSEPLSDLPDYKVVRKRSDDAIADAAKQQEAVVSLEWFARPFSMGRILRQVFEVDRGNQVDILKLLQGQGFDAIKAVGGTAAVAGKEIDFLHRGFVLAPPTARGEQRYELAARMLQLADVPMQAVPGWVHADVGSFNRIHWKLEEAFWASETLINEAFGDDIFRPMIEGIRDDEEGPQIDIAKDVLPNLDDQVILLTDNTLPAAIDSERMLVAIRVKDGAAIKKAIRQAMEVEPDASEMDVLPGVEIWRVQRGEGEDDFEKDLFGGDDFSFDEEIDEAPPLLDHWAIALVEKGSCSDAPYLVFSSHPDLLVQTAKRIQQCSEDGFSELEEVKRVAAAMKDLGADKVAYDRLVRLKHTLRVKYELLRQGQLKDSDSVLFKLLRRIDEEEDGGQPDPLNASKLPPLKEIEQHLPEGGSYIETTEDGWMMSGFFLK